MTFEKLIACFASDPCMILSSCEPQRHIHSIRFRDPADTAPDEHVLYLACADALARPDRLSLCRNLLLYAEGSCPPSLKGMEAERMNLIFLPGRTDSMPIFNLLSEAFHRQAELEERRQVLFSALTSNRGLQFIVDCAFSVLNNPILVTDAGYHFLARQTGALEDGSTPLLKQLTQDISSESVQKEQLQIIQELDLDSKSFGSGEPYLFFNRGFQTDVMISSIRIRGSIVAKMMLVGKNPFAPGDSECFAYLGSIISQELQKDTFKISLENQPESEMLFHLLNTSRPNQEIIDKRLKMMNIRFRDRFRIAIIQSREGMLKSLQIASICYRLESILSGRAHTLFQDTLVFLIELDAVHTFDGEMLLRLRREALHNDLLIGISNEFKNLTEVKQFYRQADAAIQMGHRYIPDTTDKSPLYLYQDYSYVDLINTASHGAELKRFCHPYLELLMEYDRENHTNLLETLYQFLRSSQNLREASEVLFIHKNTLSYRIGKIKEILGDDLASSETIFTLNLSFRILIFLKLFMPPEQPPAG